MVTFKVVTLSIVGTADDYEVVYTIYPPYSEGSFTLHQAFKAGFNILDHDDFWIVQLEDGKLKDIFHSDGKLRPYDRFEFNDLASMFDRPPSEMEEWIEFLEGKSLYYECR